MDADASNFAPSWFVEDRMQLLAFSSSKNLSKCMQNHAYDM